MNDPQVLVPQGTSACPVGSSACHMVSTRATGNRLFPLVVAKNHPDPPHLESDNPYH